MQSTASLSYDADLVLRSCAFDLLRVTGRASTRPAHRRMTLPSPWREVADSVIDTGVQRFASYRRDGGARVDLHSAAGLGPGAAPAGRLIASITFGAVRVAVHAQATGSGFEARWQHAAADFRLLAGPISLLDFMDLLITLDWPR